MKRIILWMLLVGLLLVVGTLVYVLKRSPEERAAIAAIEKLGGGVEYSEENLLERPT